MNVEDTTVARTAPPEKPPERFANMRVLWSFVRPHRWTLLAAFMLTAITTGTTLATPHGQTACAGPPVRTTSSSSPTTCAGTWWQRCASRRSPRTGTRSTRP
ncbi:hypothetical protein [Streptomyces sp. NPDC055709]